MTLPKIPVLQVSITTSPREEILMYISKFLSHTSYLIPHTSCVIVTPNPEQIMLAQKNDEFRDILNSADIALPDGVGIVWALNRRTRTEERGSKLETRHSKLVSRISGVDFMEDLCKLAAEKKLPVAFIGGRNGVAAEALKKLQAKYPGLTGFAEDGPEIRGDKKRVTSNEERETKIESRYSNLAPRAVVDQKTIQSYVSRIRECGCKIVFVGLGAPKQEFFIDALIHTFKGETLQGVYSNYKEPRNLATSKPRHLVFMSIGGSFDMLAGKIRRAPKSVQIIGLEWLWRLIWQPWRIKRQAVILQFILQVLRGNMRI